jgi:hypothetical protein
MHVAGGEHTGIVINKETAQDVNDETLPELVLEFRVFLVSGQTGKHTQESRTLRFWFREINAHQNGHINGTTNGYANGDGHHNGASASVAQDFFRELVSPQEFPRGKNKKFTSFNVFCVFFVFYTQTRRWIFTKVASNCR